jgi:UDP-N-acetylglucosamine 2-epimerase (non-hydrolysing)
VGSDSEKLKLHLTEVIEGTYKSGECPALWDGHAAERIADIFVAEAASL